MKLLPLSNQQNNSDYLDILDFVNTHLEAGALPVIVCNHLTTQIFEGVDSDTRNAMIQVINQLKELINNQ